MRCSCSADILYVSKNTRRCGDRCDLNTRAVRAGMKECVCVCVMGAGGGDVKHSQR